MKVTFSIPLPSSWVCPRGSPPSLCSSKREKPRKVQALEPCYLGLFKLWLFSLLYMGHWDSTLWHCASVLGVVWIALSCMLAIILWNQGLNNWVFRNFSSSSADGASITQWFIHLDFSTSSPSSTSSTFNWGWFYKISWINRFPRLFGLGVSTWWTYVNEFPVRSFKNEAAIFFKVQQYSEKSEHRKQSGKKTVEGRKPEEFQHWWEERGKWGHIFSSGELFSNELNFPNIKYDVSYRFSTDALYQIKFSSIPSFLRVLSHESELNPVKCLSACIEVTMKDFLYFVIMVDYSNWLF